MTGIRASIERSQEIKRNADLVVDSVTAEDIGKFTNENVAEALQRVPGVQIDREGGEGRFVSVRGLGPAFNRTTVNGRTAVSIGTDGRTDNRAFNFDSLATEYVSRVDVFKTPTADMDEGGMGGVIDIKTAKPLEARIRAAGKDNDGRVLALGAELGYGELVDEYQPRLSLLASARVTPTLGVLASVAWSRRSLRQDFLEIPGYNVVPIAGQSVYRPGNVRQTLATGVNERLGGVLAVQWRPADDFEANFDYLYSEFEQTTDRDLLQLQIAGAVTNQTVNPQFNRIDTVTVPVGNVTTFNQLNDNLTKTHIVGLNVKKELSQWTASTDLSYAKVDYRAKLNSYSTSYRRNLTFDLRGDLPLVTPTIPLDPPSDFLQFLGQVNLTQTQENERAGQFDLKRSFENSTLSSVEFGAKYRTRETDVIFNVFSFSDVALKAASTALGISLIPDLRPFRYDNFLEDYEVVSRRWPVIDTPGVFSRLGPVFDRILPAGPSLDIPDPSRSFGAGERILSSYAKANFEGTALGIPYRGNVGVRAARTETEARGFTFNATSRTYLPEAVERSYSDVLPSGNIKFELTDNVLLRAAAAKVIARADLVDLSPTIVVQNLASATARAGNPDLDPFRATQLDVGLEWYPTRGASFAATAFYKDIASFTEFFVTHEQVPGFVSADPDGGFDISRPTSNAGGASVLGIEFSAHVPFRWLTSTPFLEDFGVNASLTLIESKTNGRDNITGAELGVTGVADTNYSILAYYERDKIGARLTYTFRDGFLAIRNSVTNGGAEFTEAYGQLDASANYDLNRHISVTFQAVNLTQEDSRRFVGVPDLFRTLIVTDRRYVVGLRARF